MKLVNTLKKFTPRMNKAKAVAGAGMLSFSVSASAALPDAVKTSIDGAKADGLEAGYLVLGVFAGLFVIGIIKRMLR